MLFQAITSAERKTQGCTHKRINPFAMNSAQRGRAPLVPDRSEGDRQKTDAGWAQRVVAGTGIHLFREKAVFFRLRNVLRKQNFRNLKNLATPHNPREVRNPTGASHYALVTSYSMGVLGVAKAPQGYRARHERFAPIAAPDKLAQYRGPA